MTPNEKRALIKFKEIKEGNTVNIAGTLEVTINYAGEACGRLCKKGYLERLLPGMFARYRITPLGEEQVREEGESEKEIKEQIGVEEEGKKEIEETEEYECTSCGTSVKEEDTECPKCGMVFEESVEEEVKQGK